MKIGKYSWKPLTRGNRLNSVNNFVVSLSSINVLHYCIENGVIKPDPERLHPLRELCLKNFKSLTRILRMFSNNANWTHKFSDKIKKLIEMKKFPIKIKIKTLAAVSQLKKKIRESHIPFSR